MIQILFFADPWQSLPVCTPADVLRLLGCYARGCVIGSGEGHGALARAAAAAAAGSPAVEQATGPAAPDLMLQAATTAVVLQALENSAACPWPASEGNSREAPEARTSSSNFPVLRNCHAVFLFTCGV